MQVVIVVFFLFNFNDWGEKGSFYLGSLQMSFVFDVSALTCALVVR